MRWVRKSQSARCGNIGGSNIKRGVMTRVDISIPANDTTRENNGRGGYTLSPRATAGRTAGGRVAAAATVGGNF